MQDLFIQSWVIVGMCELTGLYSVCFLLWVLSERHWHWWEQTGWRQRQSSRRPHHHSCSPFDHHSVVLGVLHVTGLSAPLLSVSKCRWVVAVMTHTFLSISMTPYHTPPSFYTLHPSLIDQIYWTYIFYTLNKSVTTFILITNNNNGCTFWWWTKGVTW